jgi:hypothetical protein
MKKALNSIAFALLSAALFFNFAACSGDDDGNSDGGTGTPVVTLPDSKGENPFAGKTFSEEDSDKLKAEWKFGDKSVNLVKYYPKDNVTETETFSYTYDTEANLLYLALTKYSQDFNGQKFSYSSVSEAESVAKKMRCTGTELERVKAETNTEFYIPRIYKYTLTGETADFKTYFDGKLPTYADFSTSDYRVQLEEGNLSFYLGEQYTRYSCSPNFDNGSFTGKLFKRMKHDESITVLGTIKGTYTTEGTGTTGCKLTLKFTEVPADFESFKDKEIVLAQSSW